MRAILASPLQPVSLSFYVFCYQFVIVSTMVIINTAIKTENIRHTILCIYFLNSLEKITTEGLIL